MSQTIANATNMKCIQFVFISNIFAEVIYGVPVSSFKKNGYQIDKLVHRNVLPLFGDVVLNHELVY